MAKDINIAQEKGWPRALFNAFVFCVIAYSAFFVFSAICFGVLDAACRFNLMIHSSVLHIDWLQFFYNPIYIFELYGNWWEMLLRSIRLMMVRAVLFVPFTVPVGVMVSCVCFIMTKKYSFGLWFVLNYHFAKFSDIEKMGLNKGLFMVLGKIKDTILSIKPAESVLCVGEMGTGKTSSVAIPSVLNSDNACIIGVDMTGLLPKYTAGYRAKLGKVFYFNWDLQDSPDKNFYYPRWNPLAEENLPDNETDLGAYLKRIAAYLTDVEDDVVDDYWNLATNSLVVVFLNFWVVKIKQAKANDYFLGKIIVGESLKREEKNILLSYYALMPKQLAKPAIENLKNGTLDKDNYLPIGSWNGVSEQWLGKEVCFAGVTDWIIDNYLSGTDDKNNGWKVWFESMLKEAMLFGYGKSIENGIRQILALSAKQRRIVLACALRSFKIFTHQSIRERTDGNDFRWSFLRGFYNEELEKWCPVTVYSMANTYASKILNQMFLDEVLFRYLNLKEQAGPLPVMLVLDDVGHNLRLKNLIKMLETGQSKKISALLLCNSLSLVENTYSKKDLETIVINTEYKIIKAPDIQKLGAQLDKLATFATKSVQIPKMKNKRRFRKKYFANAAYFHRLALDFKSRKKMKINTGDHQIVLVEGFYNRPILADNVFFAEEERFKERAVLDADYVLSANNIKQHDRETPKIAAVFDDKDRGIEDIVELEQYMDMEFNELSTKKSDVSSDNIKNITTGFEKNSREDWWLDEDAFAVDNKYEENPFNGKK